MVCFLPLETVLEVWSVKRDFFLGTQDQDGLLDVFIENEAREPMPLTPVEFEKTFETKLVSVLPSSSPHQLSIKGTIDMVMKNEATEDVMVLDYKTGSTLPAAADIRTLRALQLPIYMLAVTEETSAAHFLGGMIYQVKDSVDFGKSIPFF